MKLNLNNSITDILRITSPAAGEMIVYTLMWMIDTMLIGNYGGNSALNAVGISSEITNSLINIFIIWGISIAISSLVARSVGAEDPLRADEYATLGFTFGLTAAFLLSAAMLLLNSQVLKLAGARDSILLMSSGYTRLYVPAMFFLMVVNLINAVLRGYGNTFTPFFAALLIAALKILFDICFIFGIVFPELGITGAALSSIISTLTGLVYLLYFMYKNSKVKIRLKYIIRFRLQKLMDLIKLSLPAMLEEASFSISRLLGTFIVMYAGTTAFVANQIANTAESISVMPGVGFGIAATTIVGIKLGERNFGKAKRYAFLCALGSVSISLIFAAAFAFFPSQLIGTFIPAAEAETLRLGALCLAVGALEQPAIALDYAIAGALKGAGDTKTPMYISLFTSWCIRLPLMFVFIHLLKKSIVYVWWITALQWSVDAVLLVFFFRKSFNKNPSNR